MSILSFVDYATLIGLAFTIVGLVFNMRQIYNTKNAAFQAKDAAESTLKTIRKNNLIADVAKIVALIEDIKELNRNHNWNKLVEKYSFMRQTLVALRQPLQEKYPVYKDDLTALITLASSLERHVESIIATPEGSIEIDIANWNTEINDRVEFIYELEAQIGEADGI